MHARRPVFLFRLSPKVAKNRKLAAFFDRNLAGPKVGEVADGR
jgi:hypothetical protein